MRLICPNCDAQYEVAEDAIPEEGRDVQCSGCGHAWYQLSPAMLEAQEGEADPFGAADLVPPAFTSVPKAPAPAFAAPPAPEPEPSPAQPDVQEAAPPAAPAATATRGLDEDALALLREEAEREVQARSREGHRLEVQGDLGLEVPAPSLSARRVAQMRGLDMGNPAQQVDPVVKPNKGRDLLPDIEEINSTLRPEAGALSGEDGAYNGASAIAGRRGFRSGFATMLVLALVVVAVYVAAPRISAEVPALARLMEGYVATVDALRLGLDRLMQQATAWLQA